MQGGLELLVEIVGALDPASRSDGAQGGRIFGEHRGDAASPDVGTRADVGKHLIGRPLALTWRCSQLFSGNTLASRRDAPRPLVQQCQNLLNVGPTGWAHGSSMAESEGSRNISTDTTTRRLSWPHLW